MPDFDEKTAMQDRQKIPLRGSAHAPLRSGKFICFLQRLKMIARLAAALPAVLDGLRGAAADAGHAVGAAAAPEGPAVLQGNIVGRAALCTEAAACAGRACSEGTILDEAGVEDRVHRAAHQAVIEVVPGRWEGKTLPEGGNGAVNVRLGLRDDPARFICLRDAEHGDIVFRHDDLCRAHAGKPLHAAELTVIVIGAADLAAAGHDEPRLPRTPKLRLQQPVADEAGNAPGIGRRDDNKALAGLHGGGVVGLDAVVHAEHGLVQRFRHALRSIFAVAGAGKPENHIRIPSQWSISCWMISAVQPVKVFSRVCSISFCHCTLMERKRFVFRVPFNDRQPSSAS